MKLKLGEILLRRQLVSPDALEHALKMQGSTLLPIGSTMIRLGLVDEPNVSAALAEQCGVPGVDLNASTISTEVLSLIPLEIASAHHVLPLAFNGESLQVALVKPAQTALLDEIAFASGRTALPFVAPRIALEEAIAAAHKARVNGNAVWRGSRSQSAEPFLSVLRPSPQAASSVSLEPELPPGSLDGSPEHSRPEPRPEGGRPRVLAVDDEPQILDIIDKALSHRGMEVLRATRGREALALLRSAEPDVVLLDAMLPEIHGFEICSQIKKSSNLQHVPVIIISAIYTGWNFVQDVKRIYGADDYIEKPFRVVELIRRVEEALSRTKGRPRSAEVQHALKEAALECARAAEFYKAGQIQESLDAAERAVRADPFDPRAHFMRGTAFHLLGRIYEAISEYERVVEIAPTLFSALKNLAVLYERQGFKAKAVETWMRALEQSPSDAVRQTIKAHLIGLL